MLLSLEVQSALGMVLNVPKGTADFTEPGLYDVKLVRTREGGLGIRIAEFAKEGTLHKEKGRKEIINLSIVNTGSRIGSGMWGEISQTKSGSLSETPYTGPAKRTG